MGSLVAALTSYVEAHRQGGIWIVRVDDIDPPRIVDGATESILHCLEQHGLYADGPVDYQSAHTRLYEQGLEDLEDSGLLFRCTCTRSTLQNGVCVANCAHRDLDPDVAASLRVSVPDNLIIEFDDGFLGPQTFTLGALQPNFIVRRRDGFYAYQLAAAIDDGQPEITHVVRGQDLLDSTPRQLFLQRLLELSVPAYAHFPVMHDERGFKLSKQNGTAGIDPGNAAGNLRVALEFLHQPPPPASCRMAADLVDWAVDHWARDCVVS